MYWYEEDVKQLEKRSQQLTYEPETLFYGSSSIRLWETLYSDFADLKPVNLGFGGSTLAACVWFFKRIMLTYSPKRLVVYAGDNDLGDGRTPEEVFIFFKQLMVEVNRRFGNIQCYYISLKPSINRRNIIDRFKYTNNLIETEIVKSSDNWHFINIFSHMVDAGDYPKGRYFVNDGLHLSKEGYELWKQVVAEQLYRHH